MSLAEIHNNTVSVSTLVVGLLVTALIAAFVFFAGRELAPRYAGPAAFAILVIGSLLTLLAAL